jgi:hypothetical protein
MKYFLLLFFTSLSLLCKAQLGVASPKYLDDTYKINIYKDKCTDGKCKNGGTGTLRFKTYGDLKEFTGVFTEDETFANGTLKFNNGDEYQGTFTTKPPEHDNKYSHPTVHYNNGTFKKAGSYTYTSQFVNDYAEGNIEVKYENGAYYKGQVKAGLYDGEGMLKYADGTVYTGGWKEGYYWGKGKVEYTSGIIYEGDYIKNVRDGYGTFTDKTKPGYYLTGVFKKDYPNGLGKLVSPPSIDTLTGEFYNGHLNGFFQVKNNKEKIFYRYYRSDTIIHDNLSKYGDAYCMSGECKSGKGKLLLSDGEKYEGDVKDGTATGEGKILYSNGVVFTGSFKNNLPNGIGKKLYTDGGYYEGNWVNGKMEGKGLYHWPSGNNYEGDMADNDRTGVGTLTWADGDKYTGKWIHDKRTGRGIYYYKNGNTYDGDFNEGSLSGSGTYTYASGDKYVSDNWNAFAFTKGKWLKKDGSTVEGILKGGNFLDEVAQKNADFANKNPGANGVIPVSKRIADLNGNMVTQAARVTHSEKNVSLAKGYYSVVISNWKMLSSFSNGFKEYILVADAGGKKYPLPFGIRITFEFIDSKGNLVTRQTVKGYDLTGVFHAPVDGEYTIQAKYDFEGCINCDQISATSLKFSFISLDYIYR